MRVLPVIALCLAVAACSDQPPPEETPPGVPDEASMVGADRDKFGCITSAGYRWCGMKLSCVRPFELAEEEGFENTEENFLMFCENKTPKN